MQDKAGKSPDEAAHDDRARHGLRNEVSWDGGRGRQPYANQGEAEQEPGSAHAYEGGDRGDVSGRNAAQEAQVKGSPAAGPVREAHRGTEDEAGR